MCFVLRGTFNLRLWGRGGDSVSILSLVARGFWLWSWVQTDVITEVGFWGDEALVEGE